MTQQKSMHTLGELARLVEKRDSEIAYGSETILFLQFTNEYGTIGEVLNERADELVSDEVYKSWKNAYDAFEQDMRNGKPFDSSKYF